MIWWLSPTGKRSSYPLLHRVTLLVMMRCSLRPPDALFRFPFSGHGALLKGDGSDTALSATRRTSINDSALYAAFLHFAHKDSSGLLVG